MTTVDASLGIPEADPRSLRLALLSSYLEEIGVGCEACDAEAAPTDAWEQAAIRDYSPDTWAGRVAEGVAFRVRCRRQVSRFDHGSAAPRDADQLHDELILSAAVGLALREDLQRDINRFVKLGSLADAKRLTSFRHSLQKELGAVEERLGPDAFRQAELRAKELVAGEVEPVAKAAPQRLAEELERPTQFRREVAYRPVQHVEIRSRPPRPRVVPLVGILLAAIVAYFVVVPSTRVDVAPRLEASRFADVPEVVDIRARPPSLFVRLDASAWRSLGDDARQRLLERLAGEAERAGYQGLHVTTTSGRSVGEWLRKTGVRRITSQG